MKAIEKVLENEPEYYMDTPVGIQFMAISEAKGRAYDDV